MTWQQFSQHLEGLRLALGPGSTPDPDGVLWNTDGAAQYVADALEGAALGASFVRRMSADFTAADFIDGGTFQVAFKEITLAEVTASALVVGAWAARPLTSVSDPSVAIYTVGGGVSGLPWRPLTLFQPGGGVVPLGEPIEDNLASSYMPVFNALPGWVYPDALGALPSVGVFAWATGIDPSTELSVFVEVAYNRQLPLVPPFPR